MHGRTIAWMVLAAALIVCLSAPVAPAHGDGDGGGQDQVTPEELAPLIFAPIAALGAMAAFWVFYLIFFAAMLLMAIGSVVASALAIWDCVHRDFPDRNTQGVWCILILLTRWIGALVYYFAVYRTGDPPRLPPRARLPQPAPPPGQP